MRYVGLVLLLTASIVRADEVPTSPVSVSMIAIQATNADSPHFDSALESVRSSLADLEYNTFSKLRSGNVSASYGNETKLTINDRYTLYVSPISKGDDGRVRAKVRITLRSKDPDRASINAVDTTVAIAPGKHVKIRGLKLDEGELVVLLTVSD